MKKSYIIASVIFGILFLVSAVAAATPASAATLATPTMVSPANGAHLSHYPRATTLAWKPVPGATKYKVERQYLSGNTWTSYPAVTISGNKNSQYTFNFVGDQQGRWRVTAQSSSSTSAPSNWRTFSYKTKFSLRTPTPISPVNNAQLKHYPRTTTLTWSQVPGATGYKVERQYLSGNTWTSYPVVTVNSAQTSYYTFDFVGDQQGRWRITALDSTNTFYNSVASVWRYFSYKTKSQLSTPTPISPVNNAQFYNYPRTTTLTWNQVAGATGYKVERQYLSGNTWVSYPVVTVNSAQTSYYTFDFVGMQPGRWRITALDSTNTFYNSVASAWYTFVYHI